MLKIEGIESDGFEEKAMLDIPLPETVIFMLVLAVYLVAGGAAIYQLTSSGRPLPGLLRALVAVAVLLEIVLLLLRGLATGSLPLSGLFDSMIVLTVLLGVLYLWAAGGSQGVWFGSVYVWLLAGMIFLAAAVAEPAQEPHEAAETPWAAAHAMAMIVGGVSVAFAAVTALLYLMCRRRLKNHMLGQVLGKMPNVEKLEFMSLAGSRIALVFVTLGLASGLVLAWLQYRLVGIGLLEWFADGKVLSAIACWALLAGALIGGRVKFITSGTVAFCHTGSNSPGPYQALFFRRINCSGGFAKDEDIGTWPEPQKRSG
jgi:ABC-type transport system involved in cytochrome c biogenesis permease subunit